MNEPEHLVLGIELLEGYAEAKCRHKTKFTVIRGDLHHYLKDLDRDLSNEETRLLFSQIVAGVAYAHNQHICHRDLKLENILLAK